MTSHLAVGYRDAKLYALYALAVARPIIEAQERERCARIAEGRYWEATVSSDRTAKAIAAAIRSDRDE